MCFVVKFSKKLGENILDMRGLARIAIAQDGFSLRETHPECSLQGTEVSSQQDRICIGQGVILQIGQGNAVMKPNPPPFSMVDLLTLSARKHPTMGDRRGDLAPRDPKPQLLIFLPCQGARLGSVPFLGYLACMVLLQLASSG